VSGGGKEGHKHKKSIADVNLKGWARQESQGDPGGPGQNTPEK